MDFRETHTQTITFYYEGQPFMKSHFPPDEIIDYNFIIKVYSRLFRNGVELVTNTLGIKSIKIL